MELSEDPDNAARKDQRLVSQVFARLTNPAPSIAPTSVPRPPTDTQIAISIELPGENSLGLMMPTCGT